MTISHAYRRVLLTVLVALLILVALVFLLNAGTRMAHPAASVAASVGFIAANPPPPLDNCIYGSVDPTNCTIQYDPPPPY